MTADLLPRGLGKERDPGAGPARPVRTLDTLGLLCPIPIIRTAEAVKGMREGEVVEVVSDDLGLLADMPAWCRSTGNTLLELRAEGRVCRCLVQKTSRRRTEG